VRDRSPDSVGSEAGETATPAFAADDGPDTERRRAECFITAGPITKLCAWGEEESGGHVL
jgi:hypothetical protein